MEATKTQAITVFPEDWAAPVEHNATFMFDPMHFPFPISPLSQSAMDPAFMVGFTTAFHDYRAPIQAMKVLSRNMYHFECYEPMAFASEEEARQAGEMAEETLKPEVGRLLDRWNEEHLPATRAVCARLRAMDVAAAPASSVAEMLDELNQLLTEIWTIHFRTVIPMMVGMQIFDEFYADVFGGDEGAGHELLTGVSSESVKAGLALYDLTLTAKQLGLESLFRETSSKDLPAALEKSESGRAFMSELRSYLDVYGLRTDMFDLHTPTWLEEPSFALSSVRNYLETGRDERAVYAAKQQAAEAAVEAARKTIAAYPEAVRGQFEGLLQIARAASFIQEEHNFYIDQQAVSLVRLVYVGVGARLAREGVLADGDDVFMLNTDELRNLFANPDAARQVDHVRSLVQTRKDQFAQAAAMTPPPFIGAPPAGPPPTENPMQRGLLRFFGGPPQQADASNEIKGNAGSRGIASGIAHVARTLEEAGAVRPGEILVAVTTMPAWTPLFGVAAAVVTETGGPLSHCAIVAREYGIPAVVGAHGATQRITTGQRITVDGGRGIVTIDA
jgi:phosphohistidine swiveling domain-containing protein